MGGRETEKKRRKGDGGIRWKRETARGWKGKRKEMDDGRGGTGGRLKKRGRERERIKGWTRIKEPGAQAVMQTTTTTTNMQLNYHYSSTASSVLAFHGQNNLDDGGGAAVLVVVLLYPPPLLFFFLLLLSEPQHT